MMSSSLLHLVLRHAEGLSVGSALEPDCEVLRRFVQTRDDSAFAELLRRHGPMVWAVCRQSLTDTADVEDAFQATFLALIRSAAAVRRGEAIAGWLHGVALRVVLKLKRSAVRRRQREQRVAGDEADRTIPEATWNALLAAVHEEVQRLPDAMRTAFVLCELEGVPQPDAAAQLGWKHGTLTSRLTRARQLLIDRLSRRGLAPTLAGGSLGLGVATASAAVPSGLIDRTMILIDAGDAVSPAILNLIREVTPMVAIRTKLIAAVLVLAAGIGVVLFPEASAQPPVDTKPVAIPAETVALASAAAAPVSVGLQYVPADAALFIHADAAKLWNGALGKSLRAADAKMFDELVASSKKMFGSTPDALQTVTMFWPKIKREPNALGIVLVFNAPYDKAKLKAGFMELVPKGTMTTFESPSDTVAVFLADLDSKLYGKPQPEDKAGPLADVLKEAGTGKHLLVAGSTLANMPDEIRADDIPLAFRPFKPLFHADSISTIIDLDKDMKVEIHVKAPTPPRAQEAEKALGFLSVLAQEFIGQGILELGRSDDKDPALKDMVKILTALQSGLKDAKYATDGDVARVTAKVTADLPFAMAFLSARRKVSDSAARAQSSNNLKQIAIAMHNYHDTNGSLPPAAVCDKAGKPMLSWRVLILPYLEQEALYKEFKLDEPWDSEHNKKLIAKMPRTYAVPVSTTAKANETHYRVFVGNGAAFDYLKGSKLQDIADGTSNTIMVVTAKDAVPWTKPDELAFDPDKDMTKLLGFFPGEVCLVSLCDGSVRALSSKITKATLHGTITKNGGEVLGEDK